MNKKITFLGVGTLNTLCDFICYSILMYIIPQSAFKITLVAIISGTVALGVAYLTHSRVTWRERDKDKKSAMKFFIATGGGLWVLRPLLLNILLAIEGFYAFLYTVSHPILPFLDFEFVKNTSAFIIMTVIILFYNFIVYDKIVFKEESNHDKR